MTDQAELERAIDDMTHWLQMMLSPDDPAAVLYHMHSDYPHSVEADTLELGRRVADESVSHWAYQDDERAIAIHLELMLDHATRDRRDARESVPVPADDATEVDEPSGNGEFEITVPHGPMVCGYCGKTESTWQFEPGTATHLALGYISLTGYHALGVHRADGHLVVLAEGQTLTGAIVWLPHHCKRIPAHVRDQYAEDIALTMGQGR